MERTQCQHLGQNVAEDIEAALSILFHLADLLDRLLHALGYLFFDVPDIILNGQQVRRLAGNGPARLQNRRSAEGYFVLASTWYDFLRDNKNVLEDFMWHADEAETSMALSLYGDLVHMDLAIDGGGTPLVDPKWKMAPGEASHRWQFYGAEGTFALLEKDDLDYGVIGNPTKATKEKGDKLLVEAVVEGYSELIKELLETHPVGKNPLGFRNPLGYNGFNGGAYPTFDKDHDEKRPTHLLQEVTPVFRTGRKTFRFLPALAFRRCQISGVLSRLPALLSARCMMTGVCLTPICF